MMPLPPTVRLQMLSSSRIVWASIPPSMNTLLTPVSSPNPSLGQIYDSIIELRLVYPQGTTEVCAWLCE
jgi:hypothetical protein